MLETAPKPIYDILFIVNDKGGVRKSTFLIFLLSIFIMANRPAFGFEVDDQGRAERLFGERVTNLVLPEAETLFKTGLGDIAQMAPLLDAMVTQDNGTIIVEVGANLSERVAAAFLSAHVATLIPAGKRIAILAMIDNSDDAIALGSRSAQLMQAVIPSAEIIVVQPREHLGVDPKSRTMSSAARTAYVETIEPAIHARGAFVWPPMSQDLLSAFEKLRVDPLKMLEIDDRSVGKASFDAVRMNFSATDPSLTWMGRRIKTEANLYIAGLIKEAQRMLGFPVDLQ